MTAEALVRLKDPKLGEISPTEFIPIAERSGLMITLGNYILEEVCKFISTHNMEELGLKYIEVNLSVVQCMQRDFMEIIHSTINKYKIDKKYICFEITETASNYAPEVFSTNLSMLVDDGHELALDDFGTGYGNLQRMVTTNFAIVKIDKEMIQQTCNSTQLKNAFAKMVSLFHSMNLRIVAEGVETEEQYNFLSKTGVDYIQGFYFSHAIPKDQFIQFLMDNKK